MSPELRAEINADPEYLRCGLTLPHRCAGRITREHAIIYASKKVQAKWAIPPLCAAAHGVDEFQDAGTEVPKDMREWMAYNRATDEELAAFSKATPSYFFERDRLNKKYGVYVMPPVADRVPEGYVPPAPKLRNVRTAPKLDEFEREVRAYARETGCGVEEAREFLTALA